MDEFGWIFAETISAFVSAKNGFGFRYELNLYSNIIRIILYANTLPIVSSTVAEDLVVDI